MIQKTLGFMLALLLVVAGACSLSEAGNSSRAEQVAEVTEEVLEGTVQEIRPAAVLMRCADGRQIEVRINAETILTLTSPLLAGDRIRVICNGMVSRSIPAGVNAMEINCLRMSGTVTRLGKDGFMLLNDAGEEICVSACHSLRAGEHATVYYEALKDQSCRAWSVRGPELCGEITGVEEDFFLLNTAAGEIRVEITADTGLWIAPEAGLKVRVVTADHLDGAVPETVAAVELMGIE